MSEKLLLSETKQKIKRIESLDSSWADGEDIELPAKLVIEKAYEIVDKLFEYNIFPDRVNPSAEEGICLSFHNGTQILHFEIYNNGEMGYIVEDRNLKKLAENVDIDSIDAMIDRIKRFAINKGA